MKVFLGDTRSTWVIEHMQRLGWGRMRCEDRPFNPYEEEEWALDNGAFPAWLHGTPWDADAFLKMVDDSTRIGGCKLAVLPDKVAEGAISLEFSLQWLDQLPEFPWYLAVQDGMEKQPLWGQVCEAISDPRIHGLFLGGSNRFKLTAGLWKATASMADKPLHYGRAGTPRKAMHALRCKADSLDSAFPLWSKERFLYFAEVVSGQHPQMELASEWGYAG
jgi:hypothetical protein